MNGLNHNALTCSAVPIPPWERSLQTVEAQPYFNVSQASLVLEGIVFDRNNNLLFVDVATGRVFKLTPERQLSIVLKGVVCGRGRNPTLRLWPAIFSGEIDVFPSERRNMGQEIGR